MSRQEALLVVVIFILHNKIKAIETQEKTRKLVQVRLRKPLAISSKQEKDKCTMSNYKSPEIYNPNTIKHGIKSKHKVGYMKQEYKKN